MAAAGEGRVGPARPDEGLRRGRDAARLRGRARRRGRPPDRRGARRRGARAPPRRREGARPRGPRRGPRRSRDPPRGRPRRRRSSGSTRAISRRSRSISPGWRASARCCRTRPCAWPRAGSGRARTSRRSRPPATARFSSARRSCAPPDPARTLRALRGENATEVKSLRGHARGGRRRVPRERRRLDRPHLRGAVPRRVTAERGRFLRMRAKGRQARVEGRARRARRAQ